MSYFATDYFEADYFETDYFATVTAAPAPPTATGLCSINEVDLSEFLMVVDVIDGIFGVPTVQIDETVVPTVDGAFVVDARIEPRDITVHGHIIAASNVLAWQAADRLAGHLLTGAPDAASQRNHGALRLAFPVIYMGRQFNVELVRATVNPPPPQGTQGGGLTFETLVAELAFRAMSPHWEATAASTVSGIGASPVDIPMGSASSDLLIRKPGPFTGPITFAWYNSDGVVVAEITFNTSPDATQYLVVQTGARRAWLNTTGLPDDATGGTDLSAAYTGTWIAPRPSDWVYRSSIWPRLSASVGSDTSVTTTKRWVG